MSETSLHADSPTTADRHSPTFLKAVTTLAQRQPVVTAQAVFSQHGVKLIERGVAIDAGLYERLVSHRLAVPLAESMDTRAPVTGAMLRSACEEAMARWPFFALMGPPGRARGMLLQAIEAIPLPRPIAFQLTVARETRPAVFEHAILMAILCAHLVRESGAPIYDMTVAAGAGLLHDLGMLHVDAEMLAAGRRLNGEQRRLLVAHPVTSSMIVGRCGDYPKEVARAILEHHERLDGSGYPRALSGQAISPLGRMLALCEVVSAMFDGERSCPEQRVSLLLRLGGRHYDPALVPSIHRLLRALPAVDGKGQPTFGESVERLGVLAQVLGQAQQAATVPVDALADSALQALSAVADQADGLERMLFEAGAAPSQLALLADDHGDPTLRGELWALGCEVEWQLGASADQLARRWHASVGDAPMPAPVSDWIDAVGGLDEGR